MRFLFGLWTVAVALTVSAVAAYYSIIGLTAIFAAAVVPVIIMGAALEVAKITTAIWLHSFWHEAPALMKAYLTTATVVLMIITSMGIFGFLSKAHIEQAASSGSLVAQVERIDAQVLREQQIIERANLTISGFGKSVTEADTSIQARIEAQERLIADINTRLDRDISVQNQLITQQSGNLAPLQEELDRIRTQREELSTAQQANDVERLQALVGTRVDGVFGPDTQRRVTEYTARLDTRQAEILTRLEAAQATENPAVTAARQEITRLQQAANAEIARAQEAINTFRNQLINVTTTDNTEAINAQNALINEANLRIDELTASKFELEGQLRTLEAEVGPVKYIAEMVYGKTNQDLLEQAVRWVILLLVVVFDPLAIVLVLAGISLLHRETKPLDNTEEIPHNESNESDGLDANMITPATLEAEEHTVDLAATEPKKNTFGSPLRVTPLNNGPHNEN
jgi:hypothetical protein